MLKAAAWFTATAIALLGIGLAANGQGEPWYRTWILIAAGLANVVAIATGSIFLARFCALRRNPVRIRDGWRCTYWPKEQQLKVTLWFDDYSNAPKFLAECEAQFGPERSIRIDDNVTIGGVYFGESGLISGRDGPIMAEFLERNVQLDDPLSATILVKIRPSPGVWATKHRIERVAVQLVRH